MVSMREARHKGQPGASSSSSTDRYNLGVAGGVEPAERKRGVHSRARASKLRNLDVITRVNPHVNSRGRSLSLVIVISGERVRERERLSDSEGSLSLSPQLRAVRNCCCFLRGAAANQLQVSPTLSPQNHRVIKLYTAVLLRGRSALEIGGKRMGAAAREGAS